ncbi:unnamed protein product [Didymodactylos carnosus]|uniref:Innexin n=2 Tax=Didymodactylos carnosus TaxID=1234261 RepID=A0A8S2D235_9BILA|nr:unnamed protein product [Didymodactylos carnosus]CAF3608645.1 unnamed protein product [Didymodactylos carnosus]
MLYDIIGVYGKVGQSGRQDDDMFDRFSHRWTVIVLAIFIIAISAKQFVVDDNTALTRQMVRGANGSHKTPYYIWIPYIFLAASLATWLPAWFWHIVGHRATFDIPAIINQLAKMKLTNPDDRIENLTIIAKHYEKVASYAKTTNRLSRNMFRKIISYSMFFAGGGVLTGIYFFVKLLYLINSVGQFFLMNYFLQIDYWHYGQRILFGLFSGSDWAENKQYFPRIVYCDFAIRYLGDNNLNYTVQCTLPVNLYNERIFAFYWFWLIFLSLTTIYGITVWLMQMSYRGRRSFLKKHLRINRQLCMTSDESSSFDAFGERYLGGDGILFLRLIAKNTNPVIAGELLSIMWERYQTRRNATIALAITTGNTGGGSGDSSYGSEKPPIFDANTLPYNQQLKQD